VLGKTLNVAKAFFDSAGLIVPALCFALLYHWAKSERLLFY